MEALNMDGILETIRAASNTDTAAQGTGTLIGTLIVALLICFLGLKLIKFLSTIIGAGIGLIIGAGIGGAFGLTNIPLMIAALACGIVLGMLAFFFYKFGVFIMVLTYGLTVMIAIIRPDDTMPLLICLAVGLIAAILAVIFLEPLVILVTGISGGISAGTTIAALTGLTANPWIGIGMGGVIAVIGIIVQFMMHSRKVGKKEKVYSSQVKAEDSRESDVEKARMVLDDEEKDEDDE